MQACRILLSYNVDPSIVSLQGYTAAQVAAENVLKILQGSKLIHFRYEEFFQPKNVSVLMFVL